MKPSKLFSLIFIISLLPVACEDDGDTLARDGEIDSVNEGDSDRSSDADADTDSDTDGDVDDDSSPDTNPEADDDTVPDDGTTSGDSFPLEVGDVVPGFTLPAHNGSVFTLSDYAGQIVVIGSHPFAGTAVCTQQTKDLDKNYDKFAEHNAIPFGLGVDRSARQASWAANMEIQKLWILSDENPKGKVSQMFGIFDKVTKTSKRAMVIIDQDGKVAFKKVYNTMICPNLEPIFEKLSEMKQN